MKLHLLGIGYFTLYYLENEYIEFSKPMIVEKMKEKKEHNQMMVELTSSLKLF